MIDDESLRSLEKLHQLKTDGVITEADFEHAKQRLLQIPAQRPAQPAMPTMSKFDGVLPADNDQIGWMTLPLRRYADFTGRSSRKEFWLFLLLTNLAGGALAIFALADSDQFGETGKIGNLMFLLIAIGILGVLLPYLAAQVRRLHDQNMSGWFALLNLIPYVGALVVLVFMLIEGTKGENQYGPDPKQR